MTDFAIIDHGSLAILRPLSEAAQDWAVDLHEAQPEVMSWCGGIVIEPRYVPDTVASLETEGYSVDA